VKVAMIEGECFGRPGFGRSVDARRARIEAKRIPGHVPTDRESKADGSRAARMANGESVVTVA
jgi:hypothetical protein